MSVIVTTGAAGVGAEVIQGMAQAGVIEQLCDAPGFRAHWSGEASGDYRVFELWDSREAFLAWFDGTIRPSLAGGGLKPVDPEFIDVTLTLKSSGIRARQVTCPPCGAVLRGQDDQALITNVYRHALVHGHEMPPGVTTGEFEAEILREARDVMA